MLVEDHLIELANEREIVFLAVCFSQGVDVLGFLVIYSWQPFPSSIAKVLVWLVEEFFLRTCYNVFVMFLKQDS